MRRLFLLLALLGAVVQAASARERIAWRGIPEDPAVWLRLRAVELSDLSPVVPWFRDASIIALGDATHGTHEFFAIKQQLIPLLIREHGFRVIAFEAPFGEFEALRQYVLTGQGDPARALQSSDYYFWDAQEILDFIEWARAENLRGIEPPIEIVGIDSTHPRASIDVVLEMLDGPRKADVARRYACLSTYGNDAVAYRNAPESFRRDCRQSILSVRSLLENAGEELLQATRLVEQGEEALATLHRSRDTAMAENASWHADRGAKIILWGHNEHWGKTPYALLAGPQTSTGSLLFARYGSRYMTVATIALRGMLWIYDYFGGRYFLTLQPMTEPSPDDYASIFTSAGIPRMIVSLRGALPQWLTVPHRIRIAGSNMNGREATLDLLEDLPSRFDAVIYFESTTPSYLRHFPTLP